MRINYSSGSYDVESLSIQQLRDSISPDSYVITDETVATLYPQLTVVGRHHLVLPPGEHTKSLYYFGECLNWLAKSGANRKSRLVALGGGVIGDLVGFVASAYMRGVQVDQIPTTLLAQVDSSVGGKVAIDLEEGKNLAGAFYPPNRVLLCSDFLKTLPARQLSNGLAEVIKYGFICAPHLLDQVASGFKDEPNLVVSECVRIKAEIVEQDEFETLGIRAILNFGHTVGHAIEKVLGYEELLHGEAVSIGMAVEAALGEKLGISEPGTSDQVRSYLVNQGLPVTHESLKRSEALVDAMYRDKKSVDHTLTFSLLQRLGDCKLVSDVQERSVKEVLRDA